MPWSDFRAHWSVSCWNVWARSLTSSQVCSALPRYSPAIAPSTRLSFRSSVVARVARARKTEKACTCRTEAKQSRPLNRMQEQSSRMGGMSVHGNRCWRSLALICWLLFAAGLLVQLLSPHLKISNGAFVIPPGMAAGRNAIRLDQIVARQRRMQLLSVLLTVSGAYPTEVKMHEHS